jgi:hypothetical protein
MKFAKNWDKKLLKLCFGKNKREIKNGPALFLAAQLLDVRRPTAHPRLHVAPMRHLMRFLPLCGP